MINTEPFIIHLTVFKSRLGLANLLLPFCTLAPQRPENVLRKVQKVIEERIPLCISTADNSAALRFLVEKNMVGKEQRSRGRYSDYTLTETDGAWKATLRGKPVTSVSVYKTDLWMCDPRIESTIGVPTPQNVTEILELCHQLQLVDKRKNTVTNAGLLFQTLRHASPENENPFVLGLEGVVLLRQIIATDGLMTRAILSELESHSQFSRDDLSIKFPEIVDNALKAGQSCLPSSALRTGKDFQKLINPEEKKKKQTGSNSRPKGPGVTEHRLSPRLEWLVDLGYLNKSGFAKNSFRYIVDKSLNALLGELNKTLPQFKTGWANSVAIQQWHESQHWHSLKNALPVKKSPCNLFYAYNLIKKTIGPSPIEDVAFLGALMAQDPVSYEKTVQEVMQLHEEHKTISVSAGRYSKLPQNIYIPENLINKFVGQ